MEPKTVNHIGCTSHGSALIALGSQQVGVELWPGGHLAIRTALVGMCVRIPLTA